MDWFFARWCWLNGNSAAITAIATIAIAFASCLSAQIIRLQKKIERSNRMPVLVFLDEVTDNQRSLYIKNVGYGPALNIVRKIIHCGNELLGTAPEPLVVGALAPGEKVYAYAATAAGNSSVAVLDDPKFHAVMECDDVLGGHYKFTYKSRSHSAPTPITNRQMPANEARRT